MKKNLLFILLYITSLPLFSQELAGGFVFEDTNGNGRKDRREAGIDGVAVSNGTDVVLTRSDGSYRIPVKSGNTLFVIKPAGYKPALNDDFIPQFYCHYKPEGSPNNYTYKGVLPTGELPRSIDFALHRYDEPESFTAIVFGDPQPYSMDDLDYFTRKIVEDVEKSHNTLFGISLGDIVGDNLDLQPVYKERMRHLQLPWYNVMGNHDMNFDAPSDDLSDETFEKNFGSANYAFNYGNAHFIVLDNILYPDPRDGTPQGYAFLHVQNNQYSVDYKVAGKDADYQMHIYAPKVVQFKGRNSSRIMVNFFMGSPKDLVEYRIGNGEWQKMQYQEAADPSYSVKLIEWDFAEKLLPGRRPSNAVNSTHLWQGAIKTDLSPGEHQIEVRATDRYGKKHYGKKSYRILE